MPELTDTVFLFDVDNTLLDNDQVQADMSMHLAECYGETTRDRFWEIFERLRTELGYSDYLGALELYRLEAMHHPKLLRMANWLVDYPFHERLYPNAVASVKAAQAAGRTVILSDGDAVFQPRKVEKSGLWPVFGDNVLIYVHKELELADVERHFPARHYVMIDDKLRILDAIKREWGDRVTTVFPRQGRYATDPKVVAAFPPADITVEHIGDLLELDLTALAHS
jgi:FMN phosphatase YigB (HAD superfamily)